MDKVTMSVQEMAMQMGISLSKAYRTVGNGHLFCYLRSRSADKRGRTDNSSQGNLYRKSPCGR